MYTREMNQDKGEFNFQDYLKVIKCVENVNRETLENVILNLLVTGKIKYIDINNAYVQSLEIEKKY